MPALDNANPTILSASQLPSRKKAFAPRHGPDLVFRDVIFSKPSYLLNGGEDYDDEQAGSSSALEDVDDFAPEDIDEQEIYDLISTISDPEHPVSLGQLSVINLPDIHIHPSPHSHNNNNPPNPNSIITVHVDVTPTITHCSLATVIGLGVRVRLERALPPNYRVVVRCKEGSHAQDDQVNKQLADKERVAAALENDTLRGVLDKMLETCV